MQNCLSVVGDTIWVLNIKMKRTWGALPGVHKVELDSYELYTSSEAARAVLVEYCRREWEVMAGAVAENEDDIRCAPDNDNDLIEDYFQMCEWWAEEEDEPLEAFDLVPVEVAA
jgi:hypothetical protein